MELEGTALPKDKSEKERVGGYALRAFGNQTIGGRKREKKSGPVGTAPEGERRTGSTTSGAMTKIRKMEGPPRQKGGINKKGGHFHGLFYLSRKKFQ